MNRTHIALFLGMVASSCGWTLTSARDAYAQRLCARQKACDWIGPGKTYASMDDCVTAARTVATVLWPTATCEAKLNAPGIDTCLKAVDASACTVLGSVTQILNCTSGDVCK